MKLFYVIFLFHYFLFDIQIVSSAGIFLGIKNHSTTSNLNRQDKTKQSGKRKDDKKIINLPLFSNEINSVIDFASSTTQNLALSYRDIFRNLNNTLFKSNSGEAFPNTTKNIMITYSDFQPFHSIEMFARRNKFLSQFRDIFEDLLPFRSVYLQNLSMEIFEVDSDFNTSALKNSSKLFSKYVTFIEEDAVLEGFNDDNQENPMNEASMDNSLHEIMSGTSDNDISISQLYGTRVGKYNGDSPSDPYFSNQWALDNISKKKYGISALNAWKLAEEYPQQQDVTIALIDSGVDFNHDDLVDNIWKNDNEICGNDIDDDGNGLVDDCIGWNFVDGNDNPLDDNGHGTGSAGIIAASTSNGIGMSSLCNNCKLMVLKTLNKDIKGSVAGFIQAIDYAIGHGAKILNNSYGGRGSTFTTLKAAIERAEKAGILFVAAAGNYSNNNDNVSNPVYPSSFPLSNIISVAASTKAGRLSAFSSYGRYSVDIAAPGHQVLTADINNKYKLVDGTSFAVPFVSATAAMLWSLYPSLHYTDIIQILKKTAKQSSQLEKYVSSGGVVNAYAALLALKDSFQSNTAIDTTTSTTQSPYSSEKKSGRRNDFRQKKQKISCSEYNKCSKNATCYNTRNGVNCKCNNGYQGNGETCVDIDECTFDPCGPVAVCENKEGSFQCKCGDGYYQVDNTCKDIDECENLYTCPHQSTCENFIGTFDCFCPSGYAWNSKTASEGKCLSINSPISGPCSSNALCGQNALCIQYNENSQAKSRCQCLDGYTWSSTMQFCVRDGLHDSQIEYYAAISMRPRGAYDAVVTTESQSHSDRSSKCPFGICVL